MKEKPKANRVYSRRDFLKAFPVGIAGAFIVSVVSGRLLSSAFRRRRQADSFPEGSIFTPAKDRRA